MFCDFFMLDNYSLFIKSAFWSQPCFSPRFLRKWWHKPCFKSNIITLSLLITLRSVISKVANQELRLNAEVLSNIDNILILNRILFVINCKINFSVDNYIHNIVLLSKVKYDFIFLSTLIIQHLTYFQHVISFNSSFVEKTQIL